MKLDEAALRTAFKSAPDDWNSRKSHLEIIKNAIRAYFSTITPAEVGGLVERLNITAGVMEMGERIAWGSDTTLMREAATALEAQAAELAAVKAELLAAWNAFGPSSTRNDKPAFDTDDLERLPRSAGGGLVEQIHCLEDRANDAEAALAEARKALEEDAALIAALRQDLQRFIGADPTICEGCGAPIDHDEDASTVSEVDGCWGYVADVKGAPCYRYRTEAGGDRSWPPCDLAARRAALQKEAGE